MIRLVLADDESLTRGAVGALLGLESDLTVVAEAGDGDEAVAAIAEHRPDVAVLDVEMPGRDGAEVAQWVKANAPEVRCIILTRHARPGVLRRALAAGAAGFVTKSAPATQLADVIRRVHGGGRYVDNDLAMTALTTEDCPLTDRELEVLRAVDAAGPAGTAADIAAKVHLSAGTVRNYLSAAMQKLGTATRAEAVEQARDHGWI
ncbi:MULTISPECIES: response regulator [Pseudonocardia]|jgi:two-component system, NarL family, response regulator DesR|uniref:Two component transcriptional regulator, LuxR family n=1 Tax=Pseudonocardia oroxyli TaxID=366584 RepID=A0A1G7LBQ3_PSEOR|nr:MULTISPECIES: response regulator transcription factor [Pseudonocardia]MCF7552057.1 response regulator transcription factor [Pseudonocardia sp. WMMC193]SDF46831.1 two component transcriptional regulator, LuxR family [Pseudonocardia oroxyli]